MSFISFPPGQLSFTRPVAAVDVVNSATPITLFEATGLRPAKIYFVEIFVDLTADSGESNWQVACAEATGGFLQVWDTAALGPVQTLDLLALSSFAGGGVALDALSSGTAATAGFLFRGSCVATALGKITVQGAQAIPDAVDHSYFTTASYIRAELQPGQ